MGFGRISGQVRGSKIQDFSIQCFDSIDAFVEYGERIKAKSDLSLLNFLNEERAGIDAVLNNSRINEYGLIGTTKAPLSYQDALNRNEFVYKEEYERAKETVKKMLDTALEKNSLAQVMQDKMIFTEREIGAFIFERAAMSIEPNLYYYSRLHKKEISYTDVIFEKKEGKDTYVYKKDGSKVELCIKVEYGEGDDVRYEYHEAASITDSEMSALSENGGMIDITSSVKKVYQFKEKQPRIRNAVKIFVAPTVGGFSAKSKYGDFYTGVTSVLIAEYLESKGYSVELVMILGGGRCGDCARAGWPLNTPTKEGKRFLGITVKSANEQLDLDKLLYWTADPSALKIKMLRYFNCFHWLYGDTMSQNNLYWHGTVEEDLKSPVGTWYKKEDIRKGNKDLLYFFVHAVDGEAAVANSILNIMQECENINYQINKKALNQV
jgi:hypothetical protein